MGKAKIKKLVDSRPSNFYHTIDQLGLRVVSSLHGSSQECNDGVRRALPCDMIGEDGKTLIIWRTDGAYSFGGWAPWHDGMFGGRYSTISSALEWVRMAKGIRAGTIQDFSGRPTVECLE